MLDWNARLVISHTYKSAISSDLVHRDFPFSIGFPHQAMVPTTSA